MLGVGEKKLEKDLEERKKVVPLRCYNLEGYFISEYIIKYK